MKKMLMRKELDRMGYSFLDEQGTFSLDMPENYSYQYFPTAGEQGIKSVLTPNFGGDSKRNQNEFLLEPVSVENLHNNRSTRNFWCRIEGVGSWSVTGASAGAEQDKFTARQDVSKMTAGFMWMSVTRRLAKCQIDAKVDSFVPVEHDVEIMRVTLTNCGQEEVTLTPVVAVPIYGRSADNIRDHRHVTSLLHRMQRLSEHYSYPMLAVWQTEFMEWMLGLHDRINSQYDTNRNQQKIKQAIDFIHKNYDKDLNMAVVSNYISMNYSLFSYLFKEYTGNNFVNYLKSIRMEEAKKLLAGTELRIVEISARVGYENEKHFMKTFKASCGVSPSEYRKNIQMQNFPLGGG